MTMYEMGELNDSMNTNKERIYMGHRRKHTTTCEAGDCAVHTYSVTAASTFMGKLQPFSYEARTEATCIQIFH